MLSVCCILVCIISIFLMQKGQWNRGGSVNTKETTYVAYWCALYRFFNAEGSGFSSGTGEGV